MSQARKVEILIFVNKQFVLQLMLCMRIKCFLTEKAYVTTEIYKAFKELKKAILFVFLHYPQCEDHPHWGDLPFRITVVLVSDRHQHLGHPWEEAVPSG